MHFGRVVAVILAGLVLVCAAPGWAADGQRLLEQGKEHYEFAEFQQALKVLNQALAGGDLSGSQKGQAYLYLGLVNLAQGKNQPAGAMFAQARTADPDLELQSGRYPPKAIALFEQAGEPAAAPAPKPVPDSAPEPVKLAKIQPAPAPAPAPAPKAVAVIKPKPAPVPASAPAPVAKPQPAPTPLPKGPARGYVLEIEGQSVTIDLGSAQKAKPKERYMVVVIKELVHPVTGQRLAKHETVGLIEISEVQTQVSLARVVNGAGKIKPGMRLMAAPAPKSAQPAQPAQPVNTVSAPPPADMLKIAVPPPTVDVFGQSTRFDGDDYRAAKVATALAQHKKLEATGVTPAQMTALKDCCQFRPGAYLLGKSLSLSSLDRIKNLQLLAALSPKQVRELGQVMDRLKVNAILVWSVTLEEGGLVTLACNLHKKGQADPAVRDRAELGEHVAESDYAQILARMVRVGLAEH